MKPIKDRLYLKKVINSYVLHRVKDGILTIEGDSEFVIGGIEPFYKLSKYNCDKIFGVADVEKLAEFSETSATSNGLNTFEYPYFKKGFNEGFNKAMELNKDKVFTLEQMSVAYNTNRSGTLFEQLINSFGGQPTEIEVEIEHYDFELPGKPMGRRVFKPKFDSEGCLILKRVI